MAASSSQAVGDLGDILMDEDAELQYALAASLLDSGHDAVVKHSASQHEFPEFIKVHPITPNGWCVYDCVSKHLAWDRDASSAGESVSLEVVTRIVEFHVGLVVFV